MLRDVEWELATCAAAVLVVAGSSRRLTGTPVTPAMAFVVILIAATAVTSELPLYTANIADFTALSPLLDISAVPADV